MNVPVPVRQTSSLAILSLVCGILGWTFFPLIGSIVAIITGHMARKDIRNSAGALEGDGLALTGLVLGWITVACAVLALVFILVVILAFGGASWFAATHN